MGAGSSPLIDAAILRNDPTSRSGAHLQAPANCRHEDVQMTSARVLKLPRTPAGRQLLRESILERRGAWDFPDGSTAENTDWDDLAIDIARMLREFDELDLEVASYQGLAVPR